MALPGTQLANEVLDQTKLRGKLSRHYTYRRAKDRSHKIWGSFTEADARRLVGALTLAGAQNARISYSTYGYARGQRGVGGVRFEMPSQA